jgi:hypothetical protein
MSRSRRAARASEGDGIGDNAPRNFRPRCRFHGIARLSSDSGRTSNLRPSAGGGSRETTRLGCRVLALNRNEEVLCSPTFVVG